MLLVLVQNAYYRSFYNFNLFRFAGCDKQGEGSYGFDADNGSPIGEIVWHAAI